MGIHARMTRDVEDHYLVEQIRQALARDERVSELGLDVAVNDGVTTVTGTVSTSKRRDAVEQVVAELVPGYQVRNETRVAVGAETEEVEELS